LRRPRDDQRFRSARPFDPANQQETHMTYIVDKDNCQGCGACVDACPNEAIAMKRDLAVVIATACVECGSCEPACPTAAIGPS
jgi:NAD-dependent dihydropyrimidine dehydrogenase PreA subunit